MRKLNQDVTAGEKLLRLFQRLMLDGRKHYLKDLAAYLECSPQTVMRMIGEIERVIGGSLETGLENRKRWYQIRAISRNRLGLEYDELRYLSLCRDFAAPFLGDKAKERIDRSIFNFSMLLADPDFSERDKAQSTQISHCFKGWIDYAPYFGQLEKLINAKTEKLVCIVRYRALGKMAIREHRFAVSRILSMHNALYALGARVTEDYKGIRDLTNLAIHRITDVILTDKKVSFSIPEGDLSTFGLPWHEPRIFKIRFKPGRAADYVRERVWSDQQRMETEADGSLLMELVSRSEPEVRAWVRSFGEDATLV